MNNAVRHAQSAISDYSFLAAEDRSAFDRMMAGYIRIHRPAHADEIDLLVDAVYCKWRQQRLWNIETQFKEISIAKRQNDLQLSFPKANVAVHVANAFVETAAATESIRRYETQLHRQYLRNLKMLRELQDARAALDTPLEPTLEPEPARPAATPTPPPAEPAAKTEPRILPKHPKGG